MTKLFERFPTDRNRIHPPTERDRVHSPAVDEGIELAMLERRQALRHNDSRPSHRKGLTALMQASELRKNREQPPQIQYERDESDQEARDRRMAERLEGQGSEPRRSGRTKTTRAYTYKSPTPDVKLKPKADLGVKWEYPVVYPPVGKKRTTVEFSDLERLDDGEFLNDNLIEFYLKFLVERERGEHNLKDDQVYFFSTHFYSALTATAPGKKGLNYEAVKRWTGKDDIFSHDFLVVPVNEKYVILVMIIILIANRS
jgi:Ulp1 family protease